jgi:hypothetical protein
MSTIGSNIIGSGMVLAPGRPFGGALLVPSLPANLTGLFDPLLGITISGSGISQWANQGSGSNLGQDVDVSRPTLAGVDGDGNDWVIVGNTNDYLYQPAGSGGGSIGDFIDVDQGWAGAVVDIDTLPASTDAILLRPDSIVTTRDFRMTCRDTGLVCDIQVNGDVTVGLSTGQHFVEMQFSGGVMSARVDNGTPGTDSSVSDLSAVSDDLTLGVGVSTNQFDGQVGLLLLREAPPTAQERLALMAYLSDRFSGLTLS